MIMTLGAWSTARSNRATLTLAAPYAPEWAFHSSTDTPYCTLRGAPGGQPCFGRPGTNSHYTPSCSCRSAECASFTPFTATIAMFTATLQVVHQGMMLTSLTHKRH